MNFNDVIMNRRSIRKYREEKVGKKDIKKLIEAGLSAPSSCNRQPWEFVVIEDKNILKKLMKTFENESYNPPLAIAICADLKRYKCQRVKG